MDIGIAISASLRAASAGTGLSSAETQWLKLLVGLVNASFKWRPSRRTANGEQQVGQRIELGDLYDIEGIVRKTLLDPLRGY